MKRPVEQHSPGETASGCHFMQWFGACCKQIFFYHEPVFWLVDTHMTRCRSPSTGRTFYAVFELYYQQNISSKFHLSDSCCTEKPEVNLSTVLIGVG